MPLSPKGSNTNLPRMCGVTVEGVDMVIVRGETGHRPIPAGLTAEEMNAYYRVTAEDCLAMVHGALVGWDTPGADPDHYRAERRHA